ncbi:peptidoglycan-binding domain-containing protein [Lutibaculum baratangense]|uniref:Peptidoglycan binding-like domain-containing protein n=1 Tax=Lutibaculum baratangense AMV1 TaxID=631454 RepID=V4TL98_9HYPH|nr:peptidoglycan-binding domain-containing protein [Lutibaculum baratangense]ESR26593.1 hypothetical protein N177_0812 [Lutibaculum baratangense AMV1]
MTDRLRAARPSSFPPAASRSTWSSARVAAATFAVLLAGHAPALGQEATGAAPGDQPSLDVGAVTKFSGFRDGDARRPDPAGQVMEIVDLYDELPAGAGDLPGLSAADVGQVFAVEAMTGTDPAIFLGATSVYGLFRNDGNDGWADGMWGPDGGPNTIWRYDPGEGVRKLVDISLEDGAANGGAGIGDIAYDEAHGRLFASDLWSGMIHAVDPEDGSIIETYDHGVDGRSYFLDAASGEYRGLDITPRDERAGPRFEDCRGDTGQPAAFAEEPACWGFADFRRRVWGLALAPAQDDGSTRLYYAVWGGAALGARDWNEGGEDSRTSLWSIRLDPQGGFDLTDVRRELVLPLPDGDEEAPGGSPVVDIAFSGEKMLLAERGRAAPDPEATPPQLTDPRSARVLVAEPGQNGVWEIQGRLPAGAPEREAGEPPFIHANAAGGVGVAAGDDELVWLTADPLCAPRALCEGLDTGDDVVAGLQGTPSDMIAPLVVSSEADAQAEDDALAASDLILLGRDLPVGAIGSLAVFAATERLAGTGAPTRPVATAEADRGTRDEPRRVGPVGPTPGARPAPAEEREAPPAEIAEPEPEVEAEPQVASPEPLASVDLALASTATGTCKPGEECAVEITVENGGPDRFEGPLVLTQALGGGGVSFIGGGEAGWRCRAGGGAVLCRNPELALAAGGAETIRLSLRLPAGFSSPTYEACTSITWLALQGRERIRTVQAELEQQGFDPGGVDGAMGPNTERAITSARGEFGLPAEGGIDDRFVTALFGPGAARAGDEASGNDRACATVQVELPPRPAHEERLSSFHRQFESRLHDTATSRPADVHDVRRSGAESQPPRELFGHDGRTSRGAGDRPADPLARFHQRYESRLHDDRTSDLLPLHDRPVSYFHETYSSEMHDPGTSRMREMHRIDESRFQERSPILRHDRRTSVEFYDQDGAPRSFEPDRDPGPGGLFHDGRFSRFAPPGR